MAMKEELKNGGRPGLRKTQSKQFVGTTGNGLQIKTADPAMRDAFMTSPVRPTAQINRFNARRSAPPAQAPVARAKAPLAKKPEYYTKETHPKMGWQQRMALNKQIDENFRNTQNNSTLQRNTDVREAGATARNTANNRNALQLRDRIESGLNTRQTVKQNFDRGMQESRFGQQDKLQKNTQTHERSLQTERFDYQTERDATLNDYNTTARREEGTQRALEHGNIQDQGQARDYQDYGPAGVQGITGSPQGKQFAKKRVDPVFGPDGRMKSPGGYHDEGTGQTVYDTESLTGADRISVLEEMLRQARGKQALQ